MWLHIISKGDFVLYFKYMYPTTILNSVIKSWGILGIIAICHGLRENIPEIDLNETLEKSRTKVP